MRWSPVVVMLGLLAIAAPARADMPPPNDSPDAHCSLVEQCPHGVFCPYSFRPGGTLPDGQVPTGAECRTDVTSKGLFRRCRSGGNYSGQMLYCPTGDPGSWTPPKDPSAIDDSPSTPTGESPKKKWSCAVSAAGASHGIDDAAPLVSLALLVPVALGRRRERRVPAGR